MNASDTTMTLQSRTGLINRFSWIGRYLHRKYWQICGLLTIFNTEQDTSETASFWPLPEQSNKAPKT